MQCKPQKPSHRAPRARTAAMEEAGDATPTHSDFGDTDDEKEQPVDDASDDDAMEEDDGADDGSADVVAEYEAAAATPGAPRAAHEELVVCLRAVRAASSSTRWRASQKAAWARFAERHSLTADEWLARSRDLDDPSVLTTACTILPREAKLWLELTRIKLNQSVEAGAKVLDAACVQAERDASGNLGRLFDAARALADDTDDVEKRGALYERELSAPLVPDQSKSIFERALLDAPTKKATFGAAKARGSAAFERRRKLETAQKDEDTWLAYVTLEEEEDAERALTVCERALEHCASSRLWRRRLSLARTPGDAFEVSKRAVLSLPDDFRLREAHCRCVERCRLSIDTLEDAFARAAEVCGDKAPALALGRLAAERRRGDGADVTTWALSLVEGNDKAAYAVRAYATKLSADPKQAWRLLLEDASLPPKAWLDAARASLERGDVDEARRLHKMHATKRAERVRSAHATPAQRKAASDACTAWLVFERDAGSLADFDAAYSKAEAWGVFDAGAATAPARAAAAPARAAAAPAAPIAKRSAPAAVAPAAKRTKKAAALGAPDPARAKPAVTPAPEAPAPTAKRAKQATPAPEAPAAAPAPAPAAPAPEAPAADAPANPPPPKKGPSDDARRLSRTAFLVGLKSDATEEELRIAFEGCGAVAQTRVLKDKRSGQPTGKGFVEFVEDGDARAKALKLGKEPRKALGGSAPCKIFASKYLCPDRPAEAKPRKPRAPSRPLVPRVLRRPQQGRRPGRLGVGADSAAAAPAPAAPVPAGGHSQDAFRAMFLKGK